MHAEHNPRRRTRLKAAITAAAIAAGTLAGLATPAAASTHASHAAIRPPLPPEPQPVSKPDFASVNQGGVLFGTSVLANDNDPWHAIMSAKQVFGPSAGSLQLKDNGTYIYKPNLLFSGTDQFAYRAVTLSGRSSPTTLVTITVNPAHAPFVNDDNYILTSSAGQLEADVSDNDSDPLGLPMTAKVVGSGRLAHGFISFNSTGEFFYFPDTGFVGVDEFYYQQSTPDGRVSKPAHVFLQVVA